MKELNSETEELNQEKKEVNNSIAQENVEDKIKSFIDKSAKTSKKMFKKVSEAVQTFSDVSVIKIERQQLKNKRDKKYQEIGELLSNLLTQKNADILNLEKLSKVQNNLQDIETIKQLQKEITTLTKQIKDQDKKLSEKN